MAAPPSQDASGRPLHPGVIALGSALLAGGFAADVMYAQTSIWQWANFAAWLIATGLVLALVAALTLVIDFVIGRARRIAWIPFFLVAAAALLSLLNAFVHSRDAWTSVVPEGIALSAIVTLLVALSALRGWRVTKVRS